MVKIHEIILIQQLVVILRGQECSRPVFGELSRREEARRFEDRHFVVGGEGKQCELQGEVKEGVKQRDFSSENLGDSQKGSRGEGERYSTTCNLAGILTRGRRGVTLQRKVLYAIMLIN